MDRFAQVPRQACKFWPRRRKAAHVAQHARRLAEQGIDADVHRVVAKIPIVDHQHAIGGDHADIGEGRAFALRDCAKALYAIRTEHQNIALLRLVAPDLKRRHARLGIGDVAQFNTRTAVAVRDGLGDRIGETAGTDIMNQFDRVLGAERPAAIDDFLGAPLHLGIAALDRSKIERLAAAATVERGSSTAPEPDQHGWPTQQDQSRANRHLALERVLSTYVPQAPGQHDWLVVAARAASTFAGHLRLKGAEVAQNVRPPEFVVECGSADRPFEHDLERRGDPQRAAYAALPGLNESGNLKIGDRESNQARLGFGPKAGGAFIAQFAAGTRRGTGERRNGGGMIVSLDLHQQIDRLIDIAVAASDRIGEEA